MTFRRVETVARIIEDEDYKRIPYLCSEGKTTWLIGRNIEANPITEAEFHGLKILLLKNTPHTALRIWADKLFNAQIARNKFELDLRGFDKLPEEVQAIIHNMSYNMGIGGFNPEKWPGFFGAVAVGDWDKAADEMVDSKWYGQVGRRSVRLTNAMRCQNG